MSADFTIFDGEGDGGQFGRAPSAAVDRGGR